MAYSFSAVAYPGNAKTYANAINDSAQVVGEYYASTGNINGFLDSNGTFTSISYQSSPDTYLTGINASGQIVGHAVIGGADQGFIYSAGSFTPLTYPGATNTDPQGINDAGQVVGTWSSGSSNGSFLYSNGTYVPIKSPADPTGVSTSAIGINDMGQIVGSYIGDNIPSHPGQDVGFIDTNGSFTYFSDPGSSDTYGHSTSSNTGEITGSASFPGSSYPTAFTSTGNPGSPSYSTFAYPGATITQAQGVNDSGQVAGYYSDATGIHSFVATPTVACYCLGTRIAVEAGERVVEALSIGDLVRTAAGQLLPVKWIGRRSYAGRFLLGNPRLLPVRFAAGSLGDDLPRRALSVSADHAMLIDGVLVPARLLVNGTTVTVERGVGRVDYFHVELERHDVLLAEGAPSESFLDDDSRAAFHNAAEFALLYPGGLGPGGLGPGGYCAPRVESGHELEAIRRRLAAGERRAA